MDQPFFYRCLLATCISMCRAETLGADFALSVKAFDALRLLLHFDQESATGPPPLQRWLILRQSAT